MKKERIAVDIFLLIAIFIFPWWVPAVVAILAGLFLHNFLELIVLAVIYDYIFASSSGVLGGLQFPASIFAGIVYLAIVFIKKYTLLDAQ